jgi:TonB family protein
MAKWGATVALAAIFQVQLGAVLLLLLGPSNTPAELAPRRLVMHARVVPVAAAPKPEEPPLPENAQVVEVPELREPDHPKPVETKYLADKTTRTEKQTRTRHPAPPSTHRAPGSVETPTPSELQSPDSQSRDPTVTTQESKKQIALIQPPQELPEDRSGRQQSRSLLQQGRENRLLLPATSARAERWNLQGASGTFSTDDHLPELEPGDSTLLNADKYRYADFFYRVKDSVRRRWYPNDVYKRRDPTGRVYGVKDRYTVLRVTLDSEGRLKKLVTQRNSGLEFMDSEAELAFRRAQPFPNPPQGLIQDGEINFEFGFYFEISSGRHRFRWQQM